MWRGPLRRLVELLRPARLDQETAEELSHHIDLMVERKVASGVDAREARRQARIELGNVMSVREQVAEQRTGFRFEQFAREVRHAARALRRSPALTVLSVVTIGGGIGIAALLFALVDHVVLRPLPYPDPDRLVRVFETNPDAHVSHGGVAIRNIDDWRHESSAFDGIAGYYVMGRTASVDSDAAVLITAQVTQDFFRALRVTPEIGRIFSTEETTRASFNVANTPTGSDPVVMLSHAVWISRFGGDPNVVGRLLTLDRRPFRIVGVMPGGFAMPEADVQLWIPWRIAPDDPRDQHYLGVLGRLKPGVSLAQAQEMLDGTARDLAGRFPATNRGWGVQITSLKSEVVGDSSLMLWLLLAAAGVVLLVACVNTGLLSIIRALDRSAETAVRIALGAASTRLVRESLCESAILALAGGVLGVAIGKGGVSLIPLLLPDVPRLNEVAVDVRVLGFVMAVVGLSAAIAGLPQTWRQMWLSRTAGLSSVSVRMTEGRRVHRLRDSLVVVQVALAAVVMTGAGLLVRSVLHLRAVDPGFDARRVIVVPIFLDSEAYPTGAKSRAYYHTLLGRLAALHGVAAVGGATTVPTSPLGPDFDRPVWPAGSATDAASRTPAAVRIVTSGYVEAMGLRLVSGRAIDERDSPQTPRVTMVSESLARRLWPDGNAVGQRLMIDYSTSGVYPYEVVGVVRDVKFRGPRSQPSAEIYLSHAQRPYLILNVVLKVADDPRALIEPVRSVLKSVDSQVPPQGIYLLEDLLGATYGRDREIMFVLVALTFAATFLSALAVYGVLSQRVRERSHEIAIRIAMGASRRNVFGWLSASGIRLIAIGVLCGVFTARFLARGVSGLVFGVAPTDLLTSIVVAIGLCAVGSIATFVPAWRAGLLDPVRNLRRG